MGPPRLEVRPFRTRRAARGERERELAACERGAWRLALLWPAAGELAARAGVERILVLTAGAGVELSHGAGAPRARLRRMEPYRCPPDVPVAVEAHGPAHEQVELLEVLARRGHTRADVEALRLGARRARESFAAGDALILALRGRAVARVTGEEAPHELGAGDSLWLAGLRGGEELELVGCEREAEFLLVRLACGAGRDDREGIG